MPTNSDIRDELGLKPRGIHRASAWVFELLFERSERMLALTFALLIVVGAVLLWLPVSHAGKGVSFLDSLFTATSAVCVTGLTVVDTERDFSRFGQGVILVLIQLGGLGIMTFAALGAQLLGGRMSFRSQFIVADSFYQGHAASTLRRDLRRIVAITLLIESAGAMAIYLDLLADGDKNAPLFSAVFHSVSAFCNAGFSVYSDNLISRRFESPVMIYAIMVLIVLGGLGHAVVLETARRVWNRARRVASTPLMWTLNTRVVLYVSGSLIVAGTILLWPLGVHGQSRSWFDSFTNALFQSVTCRTAGFNTIDIGSLPRTALLIMIVLMFIGGSPASCAGGVKTTSVATWYAQLRAWLRGRSDVTLLGRRLPPEIVARAAVIIGLGIIWCSAGCLLLTWLEQPSARMTTLGLMFEQVSAFGTVGLSTGVTPLLAPASKVWIILSMFVGRIGPLTFTMIVSQRGVGRIRYPEERLMVG